MKIENPAAFRYIMQEDIYLLAADKTEQPIVIEQPVITTQITDLNYLGKYKKGFLIVAHYANEAYMAAEHMAALESILKRKEYGLDDVAIFNRFTYPDVDFEQLQTYFNPRKLLLLGKNALPANLPALTINQPQNINGYPALYTFSFDEMMDNTPNKKAFWDQVKNL
ncbi:hypothetical protein GCM10027049_28820 [Mucilaginibacter puniceus]